MHSDDLLPMLLVMLAALLTTPFFDQPRRHLGAAMLCLELRNHLFKWVVQVHLPLQLKTDLLRLLRVTQIGSRDEELNEELDGSEQPLRQDGEEAVATCDVQDERQVLHLQLG